MARSRTKPRLTIDALCVAARQFSECESTHREPSLFGVTDGKAIGTYVEHKFLDGLRGDYQTEPGNSAKGIDLPGLDVDIKVTSLRQPQSSCPFRSARQKVYGIGYSLLVFVYEKNDDRKKRTSTLHIRHALFLEQHRTGDFQITKEILRILANDGNEDDLVALLLDRYLPLEEIQARTLAGELMRHPPQQGYLTISNALQWRLQFGRAVAVAGEIDGVRRLR